MLLNQLLSGTIPHLILTHAQDFDPPSNEAEPQIVAGVSAAGNSTGDPTSHFYKRRGSLEGAGGPWFQIWSHGLW